MSRFSLGTSESEVDERYLFFLHVANASMVQSNYSSALTETHPAYSRGSPSSESQNYFEAIELNVNTSGYYRLRSSTSINTYGYLYNNSFDPLNPTVNLLQSDDDGAGARQFQLLMVFRATADYILVTTTYASNVTGNFSILVSGPDSMRFTLMNVTCKQRNYSGSPHSPASNNLIPEKSIILKK